MKISSTISQSPMQIHRLILMKRVVLGFARHWLLFVNLLIGVWVGLPWLPPLFMHWGWASAAKAIYIFYAFQCHQLPQRSFFLFGRQAMYSLNEIQSIGQNTANPLILRQFIGNSDFGWKLAWSDRMVSMYTSIFLSGLGYGIIRKKLKPFPWWAFALLITPMGIDGATHALSDLAGFGQGFRDTNIWLQMITNNAFSTSFYQGDLLGSFNSWARLITGTLFGIGLVGFAFPYINDSFADTVLRTEVTLMEALEQ